MCLSSLIPLRCECVDCGVRTALSEDRYAPMLTSGTFAKRPGPSSLRLAPCATRRGVPRREGSKRVRTGVASSSRPQSEGTLAGRARRRTSVHPR